VKKIGADLAKVMKDDDVRKAIGNTGLIVVDTTTQEVADKFFADEIAKFNAMTKDMKFTP
jgi:tripartite-type tricarboxylate transporter receptor subunit TctC